MNPVDIFIWVVIGGAILLVSFVLIWALCSMASWNDEISEKMWDDYCRKNDKDKEKD